MTANGRILVVLPTLGDRLDTLEETLRSVESQRTDVALTLVVVLPERATAARTLAAEHDARVVNDPGFGISHAINIGIATATDELYYAWIGDDDLFRPGGLRTLIQLMEKSRDTVLAYGACDYIDPRGHMLWTNRAGEFAKWLLAWGPDLIPHPGTLIKLDAMRQAGLFDETLRYAMDLDLFLKLRHYGKFRGTRRSVSAFRWHADSLTVASRSASTTEAAAVKHRHLPRFLKPVCAIWEIPVRLAAASAARALSRRIA